MAASTVVNAVANQAVAMTLATTLIQRQTSTDVDSKASLLFRASHFLPPTAVLAKDPPTGVDIIGVPVHTTRRYQPQDLALRNRNQAWIEMRLPVLHLTRRWTFLNALTSTDARNRNQERTCWLTSSRHF
jgi:hypothetical protein